MAPFVVAVVLLALLLIALRRPLGALVPSQLLRQVVISSDPDATAAELGAAFIARLALLVAVLGGIAVAGVRRRPGLLRDFLNARDSAVNLAVLRIVVFGILVANPRWREAIELSNLPRDLQRPPSGLPWMLDVVPPTPGLVRVLAALFVLSALLSMLGIATRYSAVLCVTLGIYVIGIPQFYGKVSHYHHLLWFAAILAAAPSSDALSFDAIRRAWLYPSVQPLQRHRGYGLPLRLCWLLLGVIYLFPGVWKFLSAGWAWAFSDNVRNQLYEHWSRLEDFVPIVPVDRWPLAYQLAGLATIIFELAFLPLLFTRWRRWLVAAGLVFHNMTWLFMRLSFATLQVCYVMLIDWGAVARRLGAYLPASGVQLAYAADESVSLRTASAVRAADVFCAVGTVPMESTTGALLESGDARGWKALRKVLPAIPLAWLLLPLVFLIPASSGDRMLDALARRGLEAQPPRERPAHVAAAVVVGGTLLVLTSAAGATGFTRAWPIASYPTFAGLLEGEVSTLTVEISPPSGEDVRLDAAGLREVLSEEKAAGMLRPLLSSSPSQSRAVALIEALRQAGTEVPPGSVVRLHRERAVLGPEGSTPVQGELLLELAVESDGRVRPLS